MTTTGSGWTPFSLASSCALAQRLLASNWGFTACGKPQTHTQHNNSLADPTGADRLGVSTSAQLIDSLISVDMRNICKGPRMQTHLEDVVAGSDGGVLVLQSLDQAVLVGLGEKGEAVARLAGLLIRRHAHSVEVALQDVVRPAPLQGSLSTPRNKRSCSWFIASVP